MSSAINLSIQPGFSIPVVQSSNPTIPCTVYDRAGNVIDLTGYTIKLAVRKIYRKSNGQGQLVDTPYQLFDVTASIVTASAGNITLAIGSRYIGSPGVFEAELRLWSSGSSSRIPDDAYAGTLIVAPKVKAGEA